MVVSTGYQVEANRPFSYLELSDVAQLSNVLFAESIQNELEARGFTDLVVVGNGSMTCGHFAGPKPRSHSANSDRCPPQVEKIIEVDLRIIVPQDSDNFDPKLTAAVQEIVGGDLPSVRAGTRWNVDFRMPVIFGYERIDQETAIEYEVCINKEPYLELAGYWGELFTNRETNWQRDLRAELRAYGAGYQEALKPLKEAQVAECRWRMCASYGLARYLRSGGEISGFDSDALMANLPLTDNPHELLEPLVEAWSAGKREPRIIQRFPITIPAKIRELVGEIDPKLLTIPEEPDWVKAAELLQKHLQGRQTLPKAVEASC